jgi:hypothetical protein
MKKECKKCHKKKNTLLFSKDISKRDNLTSYCKNCLQKSSIRYYYKNQKNRCKKVREYYKNNLEVRERVKELRVIRYKKFTQKDKARSIVAYAIKKGELKKLPCSVCNNPNTQAHHEDYNNPLKVTWLCLPHHRNKHRKYN